MANRRAGANGKGGLRRPVTCVSHHTVFGEKPFSILPDLGKNCCRSAHRPVRPCSSSASSTTPASWFITCRIGSGRRCSCRHLPEPIDVGAHCRFRISCSSSTSIAAAHAPSSTRRKTADALEGLRMLSKLNADKDQLLQIILADPAAAARHPADTEHAPICTAHPLGVAPQGRCASVVDRYIDYRCQRRARSLWYNCAGDRRIPGSQPSLRRDLSLWLRDQGPSSSPIALAGAIALVGCWSRKRTFGVFWPVGPCSVYGRVVVE